MKSLIIATALGLALFSAPALAQDRSGASPGTGTGVDTAPGTGTGAGSTLGTDRFGDPDRRVRPETERSRSFDQQRDASPMTQDPRLGPGTGSGRGSSSGGIGGTGAGSGSSR